MNNSHARHAVWAVAAITLLTTACSSSVEYPTRETARRNATTQITITNHNWADITVYALRNGSRLQSQPHRRAVCHKGDVFACSRNSRLTHLVRARERAVRL